MPSVPVGSGDKGLCTYSLADNVFNTDGVKVFPCIRRNSRGDGWGCWLRGESVRMWVFVEKYEVIYLDWGFHLTEHNMLKNSK